MKKRFLKFLVSGLLLTLIVSCNSNQSPNSVVTPNNPAVTPVAANVESTDKIKFKTEGGSDLFALKQQADGAKLVDGKNQEIARIKVDKANKLKLKNSQDKVLGYVVTSQGNWQLENPDGKQILYVLSLQGNGNYQLTDGKKKEIYQIKTNAKGLEIASADTKIVYQVRIKEGKISLRNPPGKTVFSTKSNISPIAFACFGFDVLTREQQAALAYAVNSTGGQ
ncbi:hypothetical protein ACN23B_00770 [Anabaena sp. FACHB-709]|uniref:Lipoprotein n=2 Tax=Nostocaceae TaxID=1162 RepID=A0A1Z4KQ65_ANAVA|nr:MULTISPECIES: hypothetical protein [Nostocaceae]BAY71126.1 hypothetical protein NIES23_39400 [Trichormus variabilis NIES-23]HBW31453.1 hypothetical protein [Nostoc sp. UBA8866]MBD2171923.1 hypothetical protein [Anabaena cylindrica FACHB-318]MBD2263501.1 hypothetical protein [Anabaena sp. FACHB-709]MBD2273045.1 hypothetical protein [Nostoc sp. PCC 7120 = FACHB-418]